MQVKLFSLAISAVCLLLLCVSTSHQVSEWDYDSIRAGPGNWSRVASPLCAGRRQSPIAIWLNELELLFVPENLPYLHFKNVGETINNARIENNGHSVQVSIPEQTSITVSGGPFEHRYKLLQFHFHWAAVNNLGSEHTIGDTHYPLEAHFVHTFEAPKENSTTGKLYIAVLGVFFKLVPDTYDGPTPLHELADHIKRLNFKGDKAVLNVTLDISNFYPRRLNSYVTYAGSLTTPPCTENVQWLLFTDPVPVTTAELESFRDLHSSKKNEAEKWLQQNFRPVQNLHNRTIYYAQEHETSDSDALFAAKLMVLYCAVVSVYDYDYFKLFLL